MEFHPSLESFLAWVELPTKQEDGVPEIKVVELALISELEEQVKWRSHYQLQEFLKSSRYTCAIALVEGLAQRLPHDSDVQQWQASVYQRWGRQLLRLHQLEKARIYLKKALRTDPHNQVLWSEVQQDFRDLERSLISQSKKQCLSQEASRKLNHQVC
jgi:tetratricopeptide (TPR) repeat protein